MKERARTENVSAKKILEEETLSLGSEIYIFFYFYI